MQENRIGWENLPLGSWNCMKQSGNKSDAKKKSPEICMKIISYHQGKLGANTVSENIPPCVCVQVTYTHMYVYMHVPNSILQRRVNLDTTGYVN